MGIFLGAVVSPLLLNCGTEAVKSASRNGGRMLQDAGRAILADAGKLLMDSGHAMEDAGQAIEDAGQAIGDSGAIRDAEAQTTGSGSVCYVMWDTGAPTCGADFSEMYSGYAFTPFVQGQTSRGLPQGYVSRTDGGGLAVTAAIASPICVKASERPQGDSVSSRIYFQVGGVSANPTLRCAVCCK